MYKILRYLNFSILYIYQMENRNYILYLNYFQFSLLTRKKVY